MTAGTTDTRNEATSGNRRTLWIATAAIGAGVGAVILATRRKRRSPWDRARDRAGELVDAAREQAKPWMGVAAGTAAAGTALAVYARSRRETGWDRARRRASEFAARVGDQAPSWQSLAASVAMGLASTAYARKSTRRNIRGIDENAAARINDLTERGVRLMRRVRDLSHETRKLYPSVRRAIA